MPTWLSTPRFMFPNWSVNAETPTITRQDTKDLNKPINFQKISVFNFMSPADPCWHAADEIVNGQHFLGF